MDLRQLRYFLRVAELGSFSRAAISLAVAQSALSRQVALLEDEVGQALLRRTGRGVTPTEAGARLADHCHAILQQVENARADLAARTSAPTGHVVLGMPPSVGRVLALPLISAFRDAFPQATISVVEGLSADLVERMQAGRINIALVYGPPQSASLRATPLARQHLFLISAAARTPSGASGGLRDRIRLRELDRLPLIMPGRPQAMRGHIEAEMTKAGIGINLVCEIDGIPALLELVAAGLGHAVLPREAIAPRDLRRFRLREIVAPKLPIVLAAVAPRQRPVSALMEATLRLVGEVVPRALEAPRRRQRDAS